VSTYRAKVGDALEGAKIEVGRKDKISPALEDAVKDKMTIIIKKAVPVKVAVDGQEHEINSAEATVSDMLKAEGIILNEKDKIFPELNSNIVKDLNIRIVRVEEKLVTSTAKIAYRTVNKNDNNMEKGSTKVLQDGEDGEKEITTKITYEDGKEVSRDEVAQTVTKQAVNKIVAVGTLSWFRSSRSGNKVYYTKNYRMKATSYTADYNSTGKNPGDSGFGITASGAKVTRDPDGYSTVAVDPRVIPLGTKLYIEGYGYAIAADTGGGVRGKIIDLYFDPGTAEFRRWYTHYVNVYVVK
jgi:3D (Asp-Asp-Asp) domain-containing protein